jgi:hypothetical protein
MTVQLYGTMMSHRIVQKWEKELEVAEGRGG